MNANKKDEPSPLAMAVSAVEAELLHLERLCEAALKHPLNSEKHIQQTASALAGVGQMEERLRECMNKLMSALTALGQQQTDRLERLSARAEELQARNDVFQGLMKRSAGIGQGAGELQALLASATDAATAMPLVADKVASLVAEAEAVEAAAQEADFIDLVRHVRSLRQQLASAHAKISRGAAAAAAGNGAGGAGNGNGNGGAGDPALPTTTKIE